MATEVKILGKTYAVRSDYDSSFTNETAKLVDTRMRELMGKTGPIAAEKVAVLTALNFAGELLRTQNDTAKKSAAT